jgi:antitoxin component of MazEF toxin-antitoxin module
MQSNLSWLLALATSSLVLVTGCCKEASGNADNDPPSLDTSGISKSGPKSDMADVDLAPLPLTVSVPKNGMGAMDMSIGEDKSVTVDIGEGASLNIQPLPKGGLEELKKGYKADTILHPFKRFAKEDPNGFVVEFESDGKTGFVGVRSQDVSGAKYVCKTTGLDGVKSVEVAEQHLTACGRLKSK